MSWQEIAGQILAGLFTIGLIIGIRFGIPKIFNKLMIMNCDQKLRWIEKMENFLKGKKCPNCKQKSLSYNGKKAVCRNCTWQGKLDLSLS